MKKVYVVVCGFSGSDYDLVDQPAVLGVFEKEEDAQKCFKEIMKEELDIASDDYDADEGKVSFELTDFGFDHHIYLEIVEQELK